MNSSQAPKKTAHTRMHDRVIDTIAIDGPVKRTHIQNIHIKIYIAANIGNFMPIRKQKCQKKDWSAAGTKKNSET